VNERPAFGATFGRAWRGRCPACGVGPVFERGFQGAEHCSHCGWRFLRDHGHWLGGTEINFIVSLPAGVALILGLGALLGYGTLTAILCGLGTVAFSTLFYNRARSLFYGLDYWLDPALPEADGGEDWLRSFFDGLPPGPAAPGGATRARSARKATRIPDSTSAPPAAAASGGASPRLAQAKMVAKIGSPRSATLTTAAGNQRSAQL